jgi:hypothetical protein
MKRVETLARQAERYFVRRSELAEGNYRLEKLADGTTVPLVPSATLRESGVVKGTVCVLVVVDRRWTDDNARGAAAALLDEELRVARARLGERVVGIERVGSVIRPRRRSWDTASGHPRTAARRGHVAPAARRGGKSPTWPALRSRPR